MKREKGEKILEKTKRGSARAEERERERERERREREREFVRVCYAKNLLYY